MVASTRQRWFWLTVLSLLSLQRWVLAEELLKYVGPEAAVCLQLKDLSGQTRRVEGSEIATRLRQHPFVTSWLSSNDFQKLNEVRGAIESVSGQSVVKTFDQLLGREVVVALYAVPGSDPKGVILLEADGKENLDAGLQLWRRLDQSQTTTSQHLDHDYVKVSPASGKPAQLYAIFDRTLVISDDESLIKRTIEVAQTRTPDGSFFGKPELQAALKRRNPNDLAALYVNPRAWDSFVLRAESGLPAAFEKAWKRCQMLSVRATLADDFRFTATADYDSAGIASWWTSLVKATEPGDLPLERTHPLALLAAAGRLNGGSVMEVFQIAQAQQPLSNEAERTLRILTGVLMGLDPVEDVLPQLGPRWSAQVLPRLDGKDEGVPIDAVVSIELNPRPREGQPSVDRALDNALATALNMVAAMQNSKKTKSIAVVQQKPLGAATLRWVGPIGWLQPSVLVTPKEVVLATSPGACEAYVALSTKPTETGLQAKVLAQQGQVGIVNVAIGRALLTQRREWFLQQARRGNPSAEDAERRVRDLDELLKLLDSAFVSLAADTQKIELTIGAYAANSKDAASSKPDEK